MLITAPGEASGALRRPGGPCSRAVTPEMVSGCPLLALSPGSEADSQEQVPPSEDAQQDVSAVPRLPALLPGHRPQHPLDSQGAPAGKGLQGTFSPPAALLSC